MAYSSIEPFGEIREEIRHGQKMAQVANINRNPKKRRDPFKPVEFMNFIEEPDKKDPPKQSSKEITFRIQTELFRGLLKK